MLETCWDDVEYISAHRYSRNTKDDSAWFLAEGVEIDRVLERLCRTARVRPGHQEE